MPEHQNFRTALAGFNREDVVRYIEYLNTTHAAEIAQLKAELDYLRSREMPVPEQTGDEEYPLEDHLVPALEADTAQAELEEKNVQIELLQEELEARNAEIAALKQQAEEKDENVSQLKAELEAKAGEIARLAAEAEGKAAELETLSAQNDQLRSRQEANADMMEKELEVYRRAERVERKARERAELVYYRVNGTLTDATGKVEDAAKLIGEMTQRVTAQLSELQEAVVGSKSALSDAVDTMVALRPEPEE